jgi:hypothetical protein
VILSCCVSAEVTDAGGDERSGSLVSFVDLEGRVGKDHPLRIIRGVVNEALVALSGEFSALYSRSGRPSIPPEKLVAAASETPAQHGSFLGRRSTGSQARTPRERRAHTQSAGRAVQMARKIRHLRTILSGCRADAAICAATWAKVIGAQRASLADGTA